ncbi:MAG: nitroreductase family protein [Acidobacteriota bacterium]
MEVILSRRSIRKYTKQAVPDKLIEDLLKAAMSAPSAGNEQPWHFVVITDRKIMEEIASFHPHAGMLKEAPAAILVCSDMKLDAHKGFWVQDCSAATQNILLAAHANGLGAVWLAMYPREERCNTMKKLLGMPEDVVLLSLISLGYPGEEKPSEDRFNSARIHRDRW